MIISIYEKLELSMPHSLSSSLMEEQSTIGAKTVGSSSDKNMAKVARKGALSPPQPPQGSGQIVPAALCMPATRRRKVSNHHSFACLYLLRVDNGGQDFRFNTAPHTDILRTTHSSVCLTTAAPSPSPSPARNSHLSFNSLTVEKK
ncbi:hypothetical protein TorRG33x02_046010 [Trema orientale]|uniref:Uncharacterized protein n=1 Tax=Trema orientale TaxID=63057 RepID=A0A2P5FNR9_TREOI|nr:hypothetical protein TorRG33x02_046010 [Trema orientale]